MQPYFMPYLGYIQLMALVDKFVIYDDVNYINRGWINRNNILVNGEKKLITLPLSEASQNKRINEISIVSEEKWKKKLFRTIEMSYKKAPYFDPVMAIVDKTLASTERNLGRFLTDNLEIIANYLGLEVEIIRTSSEFKNQGLRKHHRLIDICKQLNDDVYINPIGGKEIYTKEQFSSKGIELKFLEMELKSYPQLGTSEFVPYLSILDVLMMNSPVLVKNDFLLSYKID